jgi:hypothetical protein
VTIYEGVWWYLKKGSSKTEFALSKPVPSLHDFDLTIEASDIDAPVQSHTPDEPQSLESRYAPGDDLDEENPQTALDLQIRNSPLRWAGILPPSHPILSRITATISPSYPAPTMASTTTQTLTSTQPPPAQPQAQPAPPPLTKQQIDDAFNRAFRRAIRGGGGGGGGGGRGGGGGGGGAPIPPQALQPVPCAPDV